VSTMGERIKALRLRKGWSQEQLAEYLEMTRVNISNYERNINTNIPSNVLDKMADTFNTTVDYIMGRSNTTDNSIPEGATLRDGRDLKRFLDQTEIMFDGVPVTDEEKARIQGYMEAMFWDAKEKNKRKKPDAE
jgi:HTH-type transcriptional regulator, competence development regulator